MILILLFIPLIYSCYTSIECNQGICIGGDCILSANDYISFCWDGYELSGNNIMEMYCKEGEFRTSCPMNQLIEHEDSTGKILCKYASSPSDCTNTTVYYNKFCRDPTSPEDCARMEYGSYWNGGSGCGSLQSQSQCAFEYIFIIGGCVPASSNQDCIISSYKYGLSAYKYNSTGCVTNDDCYKFNGLYCSKNDNAYCYPESFDPFENKCSNTNYTNLTGPRGNKGLKGDDGPKGDKGPDGVIEGDSEIIEMILSGVSLAVSLIALPIQYILNKKMKNKKEEGKKQRRKKRKYNDI